MLSRDIFYHYSDGTLCVPRELIQDKNISYKEAIYLTIIFENINNPKAVSDWFKACKFSKYQLRKYSKHLLNIGYINKEMSYPNVLNISDVGNCKLFTIANSHSGKVCEWCGKESYILHQHHYPIPKSLGGKDVVHICPNCHCTYHAIVAN